MKEYLRQLPTELKKIIGLAAKVSGETRMPAYLVGGCLRDLILKVSNLDLDIAVEGDGIVFARHLGHALKAKITIHERFMTATLTLASGLKVDIATTRQERYPGFAALPVVSPGSLIEDLKRRDFTINALAVRILKAKEERIIDPFGGQSDLISGRVRVLHDLSFKDDPTRILRAIRFSRRFNFRIEPKTLRLIKESIAEGWLEKVSPHRMRDELILMLKEKEALRPLNMLADLGGLSFIQAKLKIDQSTRVLFRSATKEINWFVKNFPTRRRLDGWLIYLAVILKNLSLVQIETVIARLGLRNGEQKRVLSYYRTGAKLIACLNKKHLKPERVFSLLEPLSYETIILLSASCRSKECKKHLKNFFEIYNGMRLCVSGRDLGGLGVLPGPAYQRIFAKVLTAKLNGQVKNRLTELALIKKLVQIDKKKRSV